MSLTEFMVATIILFILFAIFLPIINNILYKINHYVEILQANYTAKLLQFTDLSEEEWDAINTELGMSSR